MQGKGDDAWKVEAGEDSRTSPARARAARGEVACRGGFEASEHKIWF